MYRKHRIHPLVMGLAAVLALCVSPAARAQSSQAGGLPALEQRVAALEQLLNQQLVLNAQFGQKIGALEGQVQSLEAAKVQLEGGLAALQNTVGVLQGQVNGQGAEIQALQSETTGLQTELTALQSLVTSQGSQISVLQTLVNSQTAVNTSQQSVLTTLQNTVNTQGASVALFDSIFHPANVIVFPDGGLQFLRHVDFFKGIGVSNNTGGAAINASGDISYHGLLTGNRIHLLGAVAGGNVSFKMTDWFGNLVYEIP